MVLSEPPNLISDRYMPSLTQANDYTYIQFMSELELETIKENFPILQLRIYDQNPINLIQLWGDRKRALLNKCI